jgi:uroporphyrinogen-III decarboxylase
MLPDNFASLTQEEKIDARLADWASTEGKPFASPEAAEKYQLRARRYADVIRLRQPDRVPTTAFTGDLQQHLTGTTLAEYFYDYPKAVAATLAFFQKFPELEYYPASNFEPGPVYDRLGYTLYRWPGGKLGQNQGFQFVEAEYMGADEYDALIANPDGWLLRHYVPRVMPGLAGLANIPVLLGATELPFVPFMFAGLAAPPVTAALETLLEAGRMTLEYMGQVGQTIGYAVFGQGMPMTLGGFSKAPFDFLGDTLRGTRQVMMDLFRRPQQVIAACEALTPLAVKMAVDAAAGAGVPFAFIPLHKGADGFMSDADFDRFYWPSLEATIRGIVAEGVVPAMFVEGGYNSRLARIAEAGLPKGTTAWTFDQTDMANAKKTFGPWAAIGGNVPGSLFQTGTPESMRAYVRDLMETCKPGGGYFMAPGVVLDHAKEENFRAWLEAGLEFGVY